MNSDIEAAIVLLYDQEVAKHDEGVKVAEARVAIRPEVRRLVAAGKRNLDTETDLLIHNVLGAARSARSRSLTQGLGYLLDAFDSTSDTDDSEGNENAAYVDPMLDQAYRLGDQAGTDKVLRHWTAEDFANLIVTRYRVAAESTSAAVELDKTVQRVVDRMRVAGVATVGDVDWSTMTLPVFGEDAGAS